MLPLFLVKEQDMNLKTLKTRVKSMGFEGDSTLQTYSTNFISATNQALQEISGIIPSIGKHQITQDGLSTGIVRYDMSALASDFAEVESVVLDYNGESDDFSNYRIEQGKVIAVDVSIPGIFNVFYKKRITDITTSTAETEVLPIEYKAEPMLPLLVSYYLWLDDNDEKAVYYYNQYEAEREKILGEQEPPKAKYRGGICL